MEVQLRKVERVKTGDKDRISFEVHAGWADIVWQEIRGYEVDKGRRFYDIVIKGWWPRASRGKGSQMAHLQGHVTQLAQLSGNSRKAVIDYLLEQAVVSGYPTEESFGGRVVPMDWRDVDTKGMSALIECCHVLAGDHGWELKEG